MESMEQMNLSMSSKGHYSIQLRRILFTQFCPAFVNLLQAVVRSRLCEPSPAVVHPASVSPLWTVLSTSVLAFLLWTNVPSAVVNSTFLCFLYLCLFLLAPSSALKLHLFPWTLLTGLSFCMFLWLVSANYIDSQEPTLGCFIFHFTLPISILSLYEVDRSATSHFMLMLSPSRKEGPFYFRSLQAIFKLLFASVSLGRRLLVPLALSSKPEFLLFMQYQGFDQHLQQFHLWHPYTYSSEKSAFEEEIIFGHQREECCKL